MSHECDDCGASFDTLSRLRLHDCTPDQPADVTNTREDSSSEEGPFEDSGLNRQELDGDQTSHDAHLTGVIGELAVAELYSGSIDREIYEEGDDGYDLLFDGTSIDVKTTQTTALTRPDLIVPTDPAPSADYYYLVHWLEQNSARIVGYASQDCVLDREPRRFPGTTQNYVVPPRELAIPSEYQPPQPVEQQLFFEAEFA